MMGDEYFNIETLLFAFLYAIILGLTIIGTLYIMGVLK